MQKVIRQFTDPLFAGLLEAAPDAMVCVDRDGRIMLVNAQAELLFGYGREELAGQPVEILVPDAVKPGHPALRAGYIADSKPRAMGEGIELSGRRRDGSTFPAEISLSAVETDEGLLVSAAVRDVTDRREAERGLREQERLVREQRDEILALSTPVIQVWDKVLVLPLIGTLDSGRAARLTESLLERIAADQAEVVILDISGVPGIDSGVAQHLLETVEAARLMGTESILSGVRPDTAQSMVHLGIELGGLRSRTSLKDALQLALRLVGARTGADNGAGDGTGVRA